MMRIYIDRGEGCICLAWRPGTLYIHSLHLTSHLIKSHNHNLRKANILYLMCSAAESINVPFAAETQSIYSTCDPARFSFGSFLALLIVSNYLVVMLLVSIGLVFIEAKVCEVRWWASKLAGGKGGSHQHRWASRPMKHLTNSSICSWNF